MKKTAKILTLAVGLLLAVTTSSLLAAAATGKDVTVTGKMVCGKCTLHLTTECQNVVQVTQGTNTVNYFLVNNDVSKSTHDPICDPGSSEKVTVTGTVVKKDGKETMTPTKIDVNKT